MNRAEALSRAQWTVRPFPPVWLFRGRREDQLSTCGTDTPVCAFLVLRTQKKLPLITLTQLIGADPVCGAQPPSAARWINLIRIKSLFKAQAPTSVPHLRCTGFGLVE
jgi:hypothetical protein